MALRRYVPQFDGVRALAISAVVAYHLGYLRGGWVGVDVFFVLSGYLITSLLLANDRPPGNLVAFWGRRARRLLPAVLVLLVALSVYAWAGGPGLVPAQLRAPALATLFYVANWQQIVAGHNYFAQYLSVSPLQQTWSLAIEEQYYLVWPLVLAVVTAATRSRARARRTLLGITVVLGSGLGGLDGRGCPLVRARPGLPRYRHPGLGAPDGWGGGHAVASREGGWCGAPTPAWSVLTAAEPGRAGRRGVRGRRPTGVDLGRGPGGHRRLRHRGDRGQRPGVARAWWPGCWVSARSAGWGSSRTACTSGTGR